MTQDEAGFRALVPYLPAVGTVGYLEPDADDQPGDAVRMHYTAQYALVPRVVLARPGSEFMIVPRGTVRADEDPRLEGYHVVATVTAGHQLYRRLMP
jgi:hypothetical protein